MEVVELHRRTIEEFLRAVRSVHSDAWPGPTPCPDWDLRALVNHVVAEDRWTVPLCRGATLEEVGDSLDGDLLGTDPVAAAEEAADAAKAAVAQAVPTRRQVHLSYGDEDIEEYVYQLCADHLVHGWDVAIAAGADTRLDPEAVTAVAGWYADREKRYRHAGVVGPPTPGAYDHPQDQLLAAFGRDPLWSPQEYSDKIGDADKSPP